MIINKKIRRLIYDSVYEVELEDIERYNTYPKSKVEFSKNFDNRLSKLIRNRLDESDRVLSKRKVVVAIVTTILLISLAITAYAFRETIFNFFVSIHEDYTHVSSEDEQRDTIETYYAPTWLPDDYTIEISNEGSTIHYKSWNCDGKRIKFMQMIPDNNGIYFNDKNGEYEKIILVSHDIYYSVKNGTQLLIWVYDRYTFQLECPDTIELNTIEQIINSIQGG